MNRLTHSAILASLLCWLAPGVRPACRADDDKSPDDRAGIEFFEKQIRPVLVQHCYECHSSDSKSLKGGLRLDTRDELLDGGDSGAAIVPGQPAESLLIEALKYESYEMPPAGRLPDEVIADFEQWIRLGAPDPRSDSAAVPATSTVDLAEARQFWSFQPPRRHDPPEVMHAAWPRSPLDRFILARIEDAGLTPHESADRRTILRRLYFDLVGLPPDAADVAEFINDDAPNAVARWTDRLLASPHYGERWARLWLDLARYAEDQAHIVGDNKELFYPNAWRYRDWVIAALNSDLPYDRFVRMQLAADVQDPVEVTHLAALGFIGLGPKYYRRNAPEVMADEWEDRVDTVSRGLLGLTVACARCHDHKYDPIPTTDYYALAGVFAGTEMFNKPLDDRRETKKDGEAKNPEDALHIVRDDDPTNLPVYIRGDVNNKGQIVERGFLEVLCGESRIQFTQGSGRRELAEAIVSPDNPLTARVIANRLWGAHFGRPLAATPSNFGRLGEPATHPELLDWLAVELIGSAEPGTRSTEREASTHDDPHFAFRTPHAWSLKRLHRQIVLSAAWQQSSRIDPDKQSADPANRWLWRMNRRRLSVESWRDAILAASGRLSSAIGGKSIDPQNPEVTRRTVYAHVSRLDLNPMLALFDFPDPNAHAARRVETTTPLQKLFVLNSRFMVQEAQALAALAIAAAQDDEGRVRWVVQRLFSREPSDEEQAVALSFLGSPDASHASRWQQYAQVLLASNEMLVID